MQMTSEARGITSPGDRFTRAVSYPMWMLEVELRSPGEVMHPLTAQPFLQPEMHIHYFLQLS